MPRMPSAAAMKRGRVSYGSAQQEPRPGTKIREAFDLLLANPGIPVEIAVASPSGNHKMLSQLEDVYGLKVRVWKHGNGRGPSMFILEGRWTGTEYEAFD